MRLRLLFSFVLLLWIGLPALEGWSKIFYSKRGAMKLAFPHATKVKAKHLFLSHKQVKQVQQLAHTPVRSRLLTVYVGYKGKKIQGYAFIETRRLRTLPATFMIVLNAQGKVKGVHVLAFNEPPEYIPRKRWLKQFVNKILQPSLRLRHGVEGISGATLSAHATTRCVRKVLSYYRVLLQKK